MSDRILFLGSSIISLWKNMPDSNRTDNINIGIGGLQCKNLLKAYADVKYDNLSSIIFYCGNNDLLFNRNRNDIFNEIVFFIKKIKSQNNDLPIIVLSLLHSPRIKSEGKLKDVIFINNKLNKLHNIHYVDINKFIDNDCYRKDDIHLLKHGYNSLNLGLTPILSTIHNKKQ